MNGVGYWYGAERSEETQFLLPRKTVDSKGGKQWPLKT